MNAASLAVFCRADHVMNESTLPESLRQTIHYLTDLAKCLERKINLPTRSTARGLEERELEAMKIALRILSDPRVISLALEHMK